jgi:hypothetical protein
MNIAFVSQPVTDFARSVLGLKLESVAGECVALTLLWPLLLVVAVWNGFPLIFYDTGAYLLEGLGMHFLAERSPVYSLFLNVAGAGFSLWSVIVLQAAATAFVMVECARCVAPKFSVGAFLIMCVAVVTATGLSWYVGEVEPDCFAAVTVLAIYLLALRIEQLGPRRTLAMLMVATFAAATHTSHFLLAAGLLLCAAGYATVRAAIARRAGWPTVKPAFPSVALVIALSLVLASNFVFTRQVFISRAGPAFVFARLLQDRIVIRLLDETCPDSGYRLCAYRDDLPPTANAWLWASYSPFFKLGGFEGTRAESARIIADSLERYPLMNITAAASDSARQFFSFRTGDQVEPQQWALHRTFAAFVPTQMGSYLSARQQNGQIPFRLINVVHVPVGYGSLAALVGLLAATLWWGEWEAAAFLATVLLALVGNAVICGSLSNPHDRYQSRLIWTALFSVWLVCAARGVPRHLLVSAQLSARGLVMRLAGSIRIRH